jgi:hypothetical protein
VLQALRFPQAVREASSALKRLRGLPCPVILQESRAFRKNQHSSKINIRLYHSQIIKEEIAPRL